MAAAKKKSSAKKASTRKAPAGTRAAKKSTAKKAAATTKKTSAKKTAATKRTAKKTASKTTAAKKTTAKKTTAKTTAPKKTTAKTTAARKTAAKTTAAKKRAAATSTARKTTAKKKAAASGTTAAKRRTSAAGGSTSPSLLSNAEFEQVDIPAPRGTTKDGISYTKDFDVKFLKAQRDELMARRNAELARALRLEDEAISIIEDGEMGDVQFDDEGGEGDTMVVQRDLDRVLSSQARQTILEIDAALSRIEQGTYGYSEVSGQPIPRERLEALPETTVLAAEKVSGAGQR